MKALTYTLISGAENVTSFGPQNVTSFSEVRNVTSFWGLKMLPVLGLLVILYEGKLVLIFGTQNVTSFWHSECYQFSLGYLWVTTQSPALANT